MSEMDGRAVPDDNACGEVLSVTDDSFGDSVFVCALDRHSHGMHFDGNMTRWRVTDPRAGR